MQQAGYGLEHVDLRETPVGKETYQLHGLEPVKPEMELATQTFVLFCVFSDTLPCAGGVRLILRSKLGKMAVKEERPEMLPTIA